MSNVFKLKPVKPSLSSVGFICDESGEYRFQGECDISFYNADGVWLVDIGLPNGENVSLDVIPRQVTVSNYRQDESENSL